MKRPARNFVLSGLALFVFAAIPVAAPAQPGSNHAASSARWVGVWEGKQSGLPGLTLTLGADLGEVNGTIVLNVMRDGTIVGHEAHVILNPHVEGNALSFQVKPEAESKGILDMSMELTQEDAAQLRCPKCNATFLMAMQRIP